jgi:predicted flap endonuclease-1-like 5' DNA nuclease
MYSMRILEEGGEQLGIGGYVWVALLIFFLMVFLGWLVASKGWLKKEEEASHQPHDTNHHQEAAVKSSAHHSAKDDLTILEGIGPKVAKVLTENGISTFAELATADKAKLRSLLDAAGYKYMEPAGWIDQAALAAKGDSEGLAKLQATLKGGRKVA